MKRLLLSLGTWILSMFLLASCQQDTNPVTPQTVAVGPEVTVLNGRIVLRSEKEFLQLIDALKTMKEYQRKAWDQSIAFKSLQEFYDEHQEGFELGITNPVFKSKAGDKPYIGDFIAARLMNEDGVI